MKSVIAYCLFGTKDQYWSSIPLVIISNFLLHPNYFIRFYIHKDATKHPAFPLFDYLSRKDFHLEYQVIDKPYVNTEPTTWRVKPLWDNNIEFLFCRDIDSIPCTAEVQAVKVFTKSQYTFTSMRSHPLHNIPLMAGLCGFNVPRMRLNLKMPKDYEEYMKIAKRHNSRCKQWVWGGDQDGMCFNFVYNQKKEVQKLLLDILIMNKIGAVDKVKRVNSSYISPSIYRDCDISFANKEILSLCDRFYGRFVGMPLIPEYQFDTKTKIYLLRQMLQVKSNITRLFNKLFFRNSKIRKFYGI